MCNDLIHKLGLNGVESNLTAPYTRQQEGFTETSNIIIVNDANTMRKWTGYPKSFWAPAIEMIVYSQNCSTSKMLSMATTAYKLWHSQKPHIYYTRIWESTAYIMIPTERCQRFNDQDVRCICVGYMKMTEQFSYPERKAGREHYTRHVVFHESTLYYENLQRLLPLV